MFDPTAFDNMKVVLEGALYDLDLAGEITIVDRNDYVNLAKLSRKFEVFFRIAEVNKPHPITAIFILQSKLENLAAELLSFPEKSDAEGSGCFLTLKFLLNHENEVNIFRDIQRTMETIWGKNRLITQNVSFEFDQITDSVTNLIIVDFDRLIKEDQIDSLTEMIDVMVKTMVQLEAII